ncbi:MAG: DUF1003 domain-containing protein [archaeon]
MMKEVGELFGMTKGRRTFGQMAADTITRWAGSWAFIIGFLVLLALWMATNVYAWINTWDPYPFILLNLVLSTLAAIQAPVILMSQNRQSEKDRFKMNYDYEVNKKAEKEILQILRKLDNLETKLGMKKT